MNYLYRFLEQLFISILGGIIAGLAVTWMLRPEIKKYLSKEAFGRIFTKEISVAGIFIVALLIYEFLVVRGTLPPPEFRDYVTLYDKEGKQYLATSLDPDAEKIYTGMKLWQTEDVQYLPPIGDQTVEFTLPKRKSK